MLSQNPYSPPTALLEPEVDADVTGTGDFEIGLCLSEAWATTWANFPLWLGVWVVGMLCMAASVLTIIGIVALLPVIAWGFTRFSVAMHDRRAKFGDLFSGFSRYGSALGAMLALIVVNMLAGAPTQVLARLAPYTDSMALQLSAVALHLVVSLVVTVRLSFAPLLVVDRGLGGFAAVAESWRVTGTRQGKLIRLNLLGGLVFVAGLLALGIGIIPAFVIVYLMTISAYRQMLGGPLRSV